MFKFGGCLDLCTSRFLILLYCISYHIWDNMSFKFEGVDKHAICLFVYLLFLVCIYLFCLFVFCVYIYIYIYIYFAMLLIRHDLHHNCGLRVIGVFNLFEHCISLEISIFYSCVGLERLHLFD